MFHQGLISEVHEDILNPTIKIKYSTSVQMIWKHTSPKKYVCEYMCISYLFFSEEIWLMHYCYNNLDAYYNNMDVTKIWMQEKVDTKSDPMFMISI